MRDVSTRVMNMVRRTLVENPEISNEALYAAAVALDPSVAKLTLRQFHARYPLQVRRWEMGGATLRMKRYVYSPGADRIEAALDGVAPRGPAPAPDVSVSAPGERVRPWPIEVWPEKSEGVKPPKEPKRARVTAGATAGQEESPDAVAAVSHADRDAVRSALLRFAAEIVAVESAAEMVRALRRIDDHVNRVLAYAGG